LFSRELYIKQPHPIEFELKFFFNSNDTIIICDVGACEGEDSVKFCRIFPNSRLFAFEPVPENIAYIRSNFLKYKLQNYKIYEVVLSDSESDIMLNVSSGSLDEFESCDWDFGNKSSSILSPKKHTEIIDFISFKNQILVKSITLNFFLKKNLSILLILFSLMCKVPSF
jgi:FkbM family methyltransferase